MEDLKIDESENFALKHKPSMKGPKDKTKNHPPLNSQQRRYSFYEIVQQRFTIEKLLKNVRGFLSAKSHDKKNIYNLREKTKSKIFPEVFTYAPKVSQEFLEEWLDFPTEYRWTWWNFLVLPTVWLLWTNKAIIGLEPTNKTIRERLSNSISVLGTASGLFLVIAVAALLQPPGSNGNLDPPQYLLDIFGLIMFSSFVMFLYYICIALIALYPMIQSLRDDIAFDAYEKYMRRYGGYELFYFNIGLNLLGFGMLIGCYMIYSPEYVYAMIAVFLGGYTSVVFLSKELFLALDPISAMHLGLSNSFEDRFRAELLSRYLLEKIPNTILKPNGKGVGKNQHPAVFKELRESDKYRKLYKDADKRQQEDLLSNMREERRKASMELKSIHLNEERMSNASHIIDNSNEEKTDVVGEVDYQMHNQPYPHKVHEPPFNEHIKCQNHKPFCMKQQEHTPMTKNEHIPQTLSDQLHHRAVEAQQRVHQQYQQPSSYTHSQSTTSPYDVSRLPVLPLPELRVLFHDARYLPSVLSRKECEFAYDMLETVGCVTTGELLEYLNEMKACHVMCVGCGIVNVKVNEVEYRDRGRGRNSSMGGVSTARSSVKSVSDVSVIPVTPVRSDGVLKVEDMDGGEEYKEEGERSGGDVVCSYYADYSSLHHEDCSARLSSCWTGSLKDIHIPPFSSYRIIQYLKCYLR